MELNYIMCSARLPEEYVPIYEKGAKRSDWVIVWDTFMGHQLTDCGMVRGRQIETRKAVLGQMCAT